MIAIVDYGVGNILAFHNTYKRMNVEARVARTAAELDGATKLLLPGVGAFDGAMQRLNASGMREALDDMVTRRAVPVIGICVGMQMLAHGSSEGTEPGLGWVPGRVRSFAERGTPVMLPHMGWNDVRPTAAAGGMFQGLEDECRFYFLHSYFFECEDAGHAAATAEYGGEFTCAVRAGHVQGVQFHPEKSHHFGAQVLKNFATA